MEKIIAESYTLNDERGNWLGQVVLTNDGMFASVTDYGNFSYAWRAYGDDFKKFILGVSVDYFASKMSGGFAYVAYSKKIDAGAKRFAEKILPALQNKLREESAVPGAMAAQPTTDKVMP